MRWPGRSATPLHQCSDHAQSALGLLGIRSSPCLTFLARRCRRFAARGGGLGLSAPLEDRSSSFYGIDRYDDSTIRLVVDGDGPLIGIEYNTLQPASRLTTARFA